MPFMRHRLLQQPKRRLFLNMTQIGLLITKLFHDVSVVSLNVRAGAPGVCRGERWRREMPDKEVLTPTSGGKTL
ncbi:hypothetical protein KCP75_01200 [Salmonella enterica subsp. enterica]|nr:hypothetical protein KCP75_01200 [Salmonella enterica subsp. enterica]